jgi:SAM-dependent methyltransferase
MSPPSLPNRDNLIERQIEPWKPPVFRPQDSPGSTLMASLRRFLDLQAASIWDDLKVMLPRCQGTVLDVGCGAQPYRSLLHPSVRYIGIDRSTAADEFGYRVPETRSFEGTRWPIDDASIDTVMATETLEHVSRPEVFLAEAHRVLKPGGWMLLTVPFAARWHYIPHDYWRFTPSGLRSLLNDAGFDTPCVYARGDEVTVACYKVMALILMLLLGDLRPAPWKWVARVCGCLLLPMLVGLAIVGRVSLRSRGGNDCLGYTVVVPLAGESLTR